MIYLQINDAGVYHIEHLVTAQFPVNLSISEIQCYPVFQAEQEGYIYRSEESYTNAICM